MRLLFGLVALVVAPAIHAQSPADVLAHYEGQARQSDDAFAASVDRGKTFYYSRHPDKGGKEVGCTTCHGETPTDRGRTRAFKPLKPLAPSINPERLTDIDHVEKWMRRGCRDVLERECSVQEKADVVRFLMSVK